MSVVFIQEFKIVDGDLSTTNYDSVVAQLGDDPVDGLIAHTAGFDKDAGVFRIFDVWETKAQADQFMTQRLQPIIERMQTDNPTATPPEREGWYELHHVIS